MSVRIRNLLIKLIAITVMLLFFYPAILIARVLIFASHSQWFEVAFNCAVIYIGFLFAKRIISNEKSFLKTLCTYIFVAVPIIITVFMYIPVGYLRLLLELPVIIIIYFTGVKAHFTDVDDILEIKTISTGIVFLAAALVITQYNPDCGHLFQPISICAYSSIVLVFVVKNQQNLNRVFKRRHIDAASVPQNIRRYNIGLVIVIFIFILMLFNGKNIVIFMFRMGGYVLIGVFWIISFLLSPFNKGEETGGGGGGNPAEMLQELGGESSLLSQIIFGVICGTIVLIALVFIVKSIIRNFPEFILKLKNRFNRIIKWILDLFKLTGRVDEGEQDYVDHIEMIIPKEKKSIKRLDYKRTDNVKRGIRHLRKINDPVKKIRYMYYLILVMLSNNNVKIKDSDTTGEIYKKALQIEGLQDNLSDITVIYDTVRYGENIPSTQEMTDAVNKFNNIYNIINDKTK